MPKYYAVRVGRIPGIYRTWKECQPQVNKFSGAVYKSFPNKAAAENFVTPKPLGTPSSVLQIYVDGSHIKHTKTYGYGILLCLGDLEYGLSVSPVSTNYLNKTFRGDFDANSISNPTMEFAAVAHSLQISNKWLCHRAVTKITIYYDYIGPVNWIQRTWKINKPYIKTACSS